MNRNCIEPRCPNLTTATRCAMHQREWNAKRELRPNRQKYKGGWAICSRTARAAQPWCSVCGSPSDLTLDHTTGLVVCRRHHHSEAHGGVRRNLGAF